MGPCTLQVDPFYKQVLIKGTLFYRLTRVKSVIYSRSPGRDPVLKGDRLTRIKGTLFYRLTRIKKCYILPMMRKMKGSE